MDQTDTFVIPPFEIDNRLNIIQKKLQKTEIEGLVIFQRVDLLYFSGTAQNCYLYIPSEGPPLLMVKRFYPRALQESSIRNIVEIKSIKDVPKQIHEVYGNIPSTIGFELDVIPVNDFAFYRKLFPNQKLVDGSGLIRNTRMIKSDWEIEQMENTAILSHKTFDFMKAQLRPGLSEMEFAGMAEAFSRKHGHGGMMRVRDFQAEGYAWHVLSGKNSAKLGMLDSPASGAGTSAAFPCGAGWKLIDVNEPILVDFATVQNGYHMDETRMYAIAAMPQKALDASKAAIEIHNAILEKLKPGMTAHEIFEYSLLIAKKEGFQEPYLGQAGYKVSFVGHGIGMELIEAPILATGKHIPLVPGMTFALEPKLVFKNEYMVGVESVFRVTDTGTRLISKVPVDVFVVGV